MKCECEHITHFDDGAPERSSQRYDAHTYGSADATITVKTVYGSFTICQECADRGHLAEEKEN